MSHSILQFIRPNKICHSSHTLPFQQKL